MNQAMKEEFATRAASTEGTPNYRFNAKRQKRNKMAKQSRKMNRGA